MTPIFTTPLDRGCTVWRVAQGGRYWTVRLHPSSPEIRNEAGQLIDPHSRLGKRLLGLVEDAKPAAAEGESAGCDGRMRSGRGAGTPRPQ